jgi:hypothetical protein
VGAILKPELTSPQNLSGNWNRNTLSEIWGKICTKTNVVILQNQMEASDKVAFEIGLSR